MSLSVMDNNNIPLGEPVSYSSQTPPEYDEIELINQGSFGCIFRPNIPCEKSQAPNKKYISKIQLNDNNITNEFNIGEQIQTIPLYYLHFSPILSKCVVSIQSLNKDQVEKCDILKDIPESIYTQSLSPSPSPSPSPSQSLISTKIKYVGNKNIEDYLWSLHPNHLFKSKILYCFYYVLQSIKKMNDKGIIHFDIKEKNIIYDEYIQAPLLIDFGLSFIPESIKEPTTTPPIDTPTPASTIFYTKRVYPYWCIEIFILSYIMNRTKEESYTIIDENNEPQIVNLKPTKYDLNNSNITKTKIDELMRTYKEEIETFCKEYMQNQFSQLDITNYIGSMTTYLMDLENTSWTENVYTKLFTPEIYNTWDIYSLAITFASILDKNLTTENMDEYQPFLDLLHSIIFSIPTERPTYDKIMEIFVTL
jgi:serine/threonine protein kinase